ncbi:S-protein homolog 3-like [Silene latifolia]|uniref:S-protein homolog 3-like n=1 Tax=Silene latifolia TaxID=37657 RepID=UPI003D7865B6
MISNQAFVRSWTLWPSQYWVIIENGLSKDSLELHCRIVHDKKFEDLGAKHLPVNGSFNTSFKTMWFTPTLCQCNMSWPNHGRLDMFNAFENDQGFVDNMCGAHHCNWRAADDAIYLYNWKKQRYVNVGNWDKF